MALSAGQQGTTTSRELNKLQYAITNIADDITTAATGDKVVLLDASDNYVPKYADGANLLEVIGTTATAAELTASVAGLLATTAEINRAADVSTRLIAAGGTLSVTVAAHDGKTILLDTAAGSVCTLPAASGTGARFKFSVSVIATSNSHIVKVANASDIIQGIIVAISDGTNSELGWIAGAADDTITLNRSTTGSVTRGEWLELEDVAANLWLVRGSVAQNGTEATPFSATVA